MGYIVIILGYVIVSMGILVVFLVLIVVNLFLKFDFWFFVFVGVMWFGLWIFMCGFNIVDMMFL